MKFLPLLLASLLICALAHAKPKPDDDDEDDGWGMSSEEEEESAPAAAPPAKPAPPALAPASIPATAPVVPAPANPSPPLESNSQNHTHHHNHTPHHHHQVPRAEQTILEQQQAPPILPANTVAYNGSCSESEYGSKCDAANGMACVSGMCKCDPKDGSFYSRSLAKCVKYAMRTNAFSCVHDDQCQQGNGTMGPYSRCVLATGRCECAAEINGVRVIRHNDYCYKQKRVGEFCLETEVCNASILGKAVCMVPPVDSNDTIIHSLPNNGSKACLCDWDHVFYNVSGSKQDECLPRGTSESANCKADVQCTAGLGPYSRCFAQKCQCADMVGMKGEAVFYQAYCYKKLALNDICESDIQCRASISENAVCVRHESYLPNEKTCQCPEGQTCVKDEEKDGAGDIVMSLSVFLFSVVAHKILN